MAKLNCASLVAIAAFSVAGVAANPAGAATLGSGVGPNLNLNPAVKTGVALAYLSKAKTMQQIIPHHHHNNDDGAVAQLQKQGSKSSESSFKA